MTVSGLRYVELLNLGSTEAPPRRGLHVLSNCSHLFVDISVSRPEWVKFIFGLGHDMIQGPRVRGRPVLSGLFSILNALYQISQEPFKHIGPYK